MDPALRFDQFTTGFRQTTCTNKCVELLAAGGSADKPTLGGKIGAQLAAAEVRMRMTSLAQPYSLRTAY
jgi:hypothetical protein